MISMNNDELILIVVTLGVMFVGYLLFFRKPSEVSASSSSSSTSPETGNSDATQQEILKQLKQINWAVRVGFLFIMLVISGVIKPGIFAF